MKDRALRILLYFLGDSKWSQFCHLVLYGKCLNVVFTYFNMSIKSAVLDFPIGILHHHVSSFLRNQQTVLLYRLITNKSKVISIETYG